MSPGPTFAFKVLREHQVVARGLTSGSPDECSCGEKILPEWYGPEPIEDRRAVAFADHQAEVLASSEEYRPVPSELIEEIYYHFRCFDSDRSAPSNSTYQLGNKVHDLATWHHTYDSNTGTLSYEREDQ